MNLKKVSECIYLIRFPDLFNTNCAIMETDRYIFVIDTFTGPEAMRDLLNFINERGRKKQLYVINTHSHFDHIWGNCAFPNATVVAHMLCSFKMKQEAKETLEQIRKSNPEWIKGNVRIVYPDIVFTDRLCFYDNDYIIELQHLPGHSSDSIAVFLYPHGVCFAGDIVEDPFPLLQEIEQDSHIDVYLKSLKKLKERGLSKIIPGHGSIFDPFIIHENLKYLKMLKIHIKKQLTIDEKPIPQNVPVHLCMKRHVDLCDFYKDAHSNNIKKVAEYLSRKNIFLSRK